MLDAGETNALDPDTDGGGVCDGARVDNDADGVDPVDPCVGSEVDNGTDPTDPSDDATDGDGDGVLDADDICPGTVLPEPTPQSPKKNRYTADAYGDFVDPNGRMAGLTVNDTGGCSAAQIIEAAGLGKGQARSGITLSALLDWVNGLAD